MTTQVGTRGRQPTARRTRGYRQAEAITSSGQAAELVAVGPVVLVEGVRRLVEPANIPSTALVAFGAVGLVGNLVSVAVPVGHESASLNLRAALLKVVNDAPGT